MLNFNFSMPTKMYFGRGQEKKIGTYLKNEGAKRVLLHYGGGSVIKSGLYIRIKEYLYKSGIYYIELGGVVPNPRLSKVNEGIAMCRNNNIDFILAIGGGSVIDSAKAIGLGAGYDGDVWDFFDGADIKVKKPIPVGVILTIPAAGSESSKNTVITKEAGKIKRGFGDEQLRPKFAVLNPELCFTLPKNQIANGVSDILAHLMERYFTNTKNVDITDNLIEATMRTVIKHAKIVLADTKNYASWCEIMWAGSIAHNDFMSVGRIGDWASHGIEHELSAQYDIAHGAGLAVIFPAWMRYVYSHDIKRFLRFFREVFAVEDGSAAEETILNGIKALEDFYLSIGLKVRSSELGVKNTDFKKMAEKLVGDGTRGEFVKLTKEDIVKIYKLSY